MTDGSDGWTPPSGGGEPPRFGERVPGWTPAPAVPPPTAYRPPPRPGLIPLHPLSFGQLLGASFGVIRWNPRAAVVPALVVAVLQTTLLLGGFAAFGLSAFDRLQRAGGAADQLQILGGLAAGGILYGLLVIVVSVVTSALLQGMLVTVVAGAAEGRRVPIGTALRAAWRRTLPLVGVALLLGAVQVVAVVVLAVVVAFTAQTGRGSGLWIAIVVGVLGAIAFIVGYAFVTVKLITVPSVIVLEGRGVFASIRRSWILMRGAFWRSFGLLAVVFLLVGAAAQLVTLPFSVIGGAVGGLLAPNAGGDLSAESLLPLFASTLPGTIVGVIVQGIGQVAQVAALVLVYLDLRMRKEGLDLELQRYAEEGGQDPFERTR